MPSPRDGRPNALRRRRASVFILLSALVLAAVQWPRGGEARAALVPLDPVDFAAVDPPPSAHAPLRFGARLFAGFMLVGILLGWLLYPLPL